MQLNLHLLRIFAAVTEQRSFSRAAETLCISQPAVSKAVRELEHQLGLPLIERGIGGTRGAKGVRLTDSGQALFDHARGIFALERAAVEEVRARVGLKSGRLVVGASTTIAGYWLPSYVAGFLQQFPSAQLTVQVGNTQAMSRALIDCEIDIALVEGRVTDPRIVSTHWRNDELTIIAPRNLAVTRGRQPNLNALNEQVWLLREIGSGTREATGGAMRNLGIEPQRSIEIGSNEGIARAVAAGLGIAMLPTQVVRELIMLNEVKAVHFRETSMLERPLFLLQLKQRPSAPLVNAFCELLKQAQGNSRSSAKGR